jgi:hypothetical protein
LNDLGLNIFERTTRICNPKDSDGQIKKYRWWYYKEGDETERGVKTTSNPFAELTVLGDGLP